MAKAISPIFVAQRSIISIQDGATPVQAEIDFRIGQGQAIEMFSSRAYVRETIVVGVDAATIQNATLILSLHRRTGTLFDLATATAVDELQSEVMHVVEYSTVVVQVAAENTMVQHTVRGPEKQDYKQMFDKPLLLAGNLSVRADPTTSITGAMTWNEIGYSVWYRYVIATPAELATAFFARA